MKRCIKKLKNLSVEQGHPLFQVNDTVTLLDIGVVPPKYGLDIMKLIQSFLRKHNLIAVPFDKMLDAE